MHYLHTHSIAHRDLNLVTFSSRDRRRAKVADFGLANLSMKRKEAEANSERRWRYVLYIIKGRTFFKRQNRRQASQKRIGER